MKLYSIIGGLHIKGNKKILYIYKKYGAIILQLCYINITEQCNLQLRPTSYL